MVSQIRKMEIKMGFPGKVLSKKLEATKKLMSRYLGSIDRIEKGRKVYSTKFRFLKIFKFRKRFGYKSFQIFYWKKSTKQIKKHSMISLRDCEK